jgi:hypothetical protein
VDLKVKEGHQQRCLYREFVVINDITQHRIKIQSASFPTASSTLTMAMVMTAYNMTSNSSSTGITTTTGIAGTLVVAAQLAAASYSRLTTYGQKQRPK